MEEALLEIARSIDWLGYMIFVGLVINGILK